MRTFVSCTCGIVLLLVMISFAADAQDDYVPPEKPDTAWFEIAAPTGKVAHSLYHSIDLLDQRPQTAILGTIGTNTYYDLVVAAAHPLDGQLDTLVNRLTDGTAGAGGLLLQLQKFTIYDINMSIGHRVGTSIRAVLYTRDDRGYRKLAVLDTAVKLPSGRATGSSVRGRLSETIGVAISRFIANSLLQAPADGVGYYSREEVVAIDSVEKMHLPLYTADSLTDGVYVDFHSFLQQKPDYIQFLAPEMEGQISDVLVRTPTEASKNFTAEEVFAVVKKGQAYASTKDGYKLLKKIGNDFTYTGKIKVAGNSQANLVAVVSWALTISSFGRFRVLAFWEMAKKKKFLLKMDYTSGVFVPVKEVE